MFMMIKCRPKLVRDSVMCRKSQVKSSHGINMFRRQGCPHLGQMHGPIVSSRHRVSRQSEVLSQISRPSEGRPSGVFPYQWYLDFWHQMIFKVTIMLH